MARNYMHWKGIAEWIKFRIGAIRMDQIFVRNYTAFFIALVLYAAALIYILVAGNLAINQAEKNVSHSYNVLIASERMTHLVQGMLSAHHSYLLSDNKETLEKYEAKKGQISEQIANAGELVLDNPSQVSRLGEVSNYSTQLIVKLDEFTTKSKSNTKDVRTVSKKDIQIIEGLKDNIVTILSALTKEEKTLLSRRQEEAASQKIRYFVFLFSGVIIAAAMLFLFNGSLLRSQRRRTRVEASLKSTDERFALAIEGTQDGIFDWNLQTGEMFYSRQFFRMLGYDRDSFVGTMDEFKQLLHPEDSMRVWQFLESYLNGEVSEYAQEFRLKNKSGRWVWIQSRAKSILDYQGKPIRLVGAYTDISHVKEKQERLEAEKRAAEEANRAKADFLAHMSHEIRTPLTAVSGIAEIFLRKQDNLDEKQKVLVQTLYSSTAGLKDLINDILDFSKIDSGEVELDISTFELEEVFAPVVDMMGLRANEKKINFVFDYSRLEGASFNGDRARIRQILINLIGNAIKFTEEGGVRVSAYREGDTGERFLRVDITDTGIGIAPENYDMVFERFKQADHSVSRKYGGTGLGLPISKNLAKMMGGTITLNSQLGKGSTFSLIIPDMMASEADVEETEKAEALDLNERIKATVTEKSRILVVEDYEGNLVVLGYVLEELGCLYDIAHNGVEALTLYEKNKYDIIFMDIQMPVMDGFRATAEIRRIEAEESKEHTPIIGMTAHALVGDKDKCIEAGMDAYLPKPLVENDLKEQILLYLRKKNKAAA
ncbi:MAG: response regulator [Alphaproteobacteria bacterium]|nr:response regulator [Alphaproteobacteria bacterium]